MGALDPVVDLGLVRGVVAHARLHLLGRALQVRSGVLDGTVLLDRLDHLPDIEAGAGKAGASSRRPVAEDDERVLVHPQPLLEVPLGEVGL